MVRTNSGAVLKDAEIFTALGLFQSSSEEAGEVSRHLKPFSEDVQKSFSASEQLQMYLHEF